MKKYALFLMLLFLTPSTYAEKLLIGSSPMNPPFGSIADKKEQFFGFDISIMSEICDRMNKTCQFVPIPFNDLFPLIQSGKLDVAISAIIMTPDRQKKFLFSLPYLASSARFLTLKGSPIRTPQDIPGKIIGVREGTPFLELVKTLYGDRVSIKLYPLVSNLLEALSHHAVDLVILDAHAAIFWKDNSPDQYQIIGAPLPLGDGYAIMTKQGREALIQQINQALLAMENDGTYLKIYDTYFQGPTRESN